MSQQIRVGVMRGGPSSEYEVSLDTGAAVLSALRAAPENRYQAHDIFIDRDGVWHLNGVVFEPERAHQNFDVIWNALHGAYGEDGKVQAILEAHGMPFTGSDSLSSAVAMNKILAKQTLTKHGLKSPYWKEVLSDDVDRDAASTAAALFKSFIMPAVVKPSSSGSSVGVSIVRIYAELIPALKEAAKHGHSILVEEFIPGIEATCAVIEGFRDEELYALPPIEIRPVNAFFDYEAKYAGKSKEIVPSSFPEKIKKEIEDLARRAHKALGLRHYSRTDLIVHPRRGIYILETNSLPGLTEGSLLPKALRAVGSDLPRFVDHIIQLVL